MSVRSMFGVLFFSAITLLSSFDVASAQTNSQRDAVIGGVTGAILGGIVGNQNDETPEGIAIGGVAGAIAGHVIGKTKDRNIQQQHYYHQQAVQAAQQRQYQQAVQLQKALSIDDAISLSNSGVSPQLIINQIHANGVQQEVGVSQIITLHQNGVSELVINEMQRASVGSGNVVASAPVYVEPTVVYEPAPVAPVVVARPRPTVIVTPHPTVYRSHRGYHPYRGPHPRSASGIYIGTRR